MTEPLVDEIDPAGDIIIIVPADPTPTPSQGPSVDHEGPEAPPQPPKAKFQVSSKHLTLASGYFHGRLAADWSEGRVLAENGIAVLQMPNVDPEALTILLNIIHGRSRQVPRAVIFDSLVELTILTDYLQCHEVVEPFGVLWTTAISSTIPTDEVNYELKGWIAASLCFRDERIFAQTTQTAQRYGTEPFDAEGLPIPRGITNDIDSRREAHLAKMYRLLRRRAKHLNHGPYACNYNCDAMYLGLLMRLDHELGSPISTRKRRPYRGVSSDDICQQLSAWATEMRNSLGRSHGTSCGNWYKPLGADVTAHLGQSDLMGLNLPVLT